MTAATMSMVLPSAGLASDAKSLTALRERAVTDPKTAVREVAKQFEALFMREVMKSMRAATMSSGMLDNEGSKLGTEMLDTQFSTQLSGLKGGLSEAITRQLERQMGLSPGPIPKAAALERNPLRESTDKPVRIPQVGAAAFVQQHQAAAQAAQAATGINAAFMIGQAAHESGWGRREIRDQDGAPSFNLFGIKAGAGWRGPVAETTTTEVVNGVPQKMVERFRAYASHAESFADYARLMQDNPRYQAVLRGGQDASGFAQGLQRAGYATDPAYADKLTRIINTTLRLQQAAAAQ
ncbi:MAG: flagellar assembly peptidoglycan hydrolase FlgJ [Rubrivivax sp.]